MMTEKAAGLLKIVGALDGTKMAILKLVTVNA